MTITATALRQNLFSILDKVIATGLPVELVRKGETIKIVVEKKQSKLKNLKSHPNTITGEPDDFVNINWSNSWRKESF